MSCAWGCSDQVAQYYQWFLDVEFMVFLGFGGLMTFLRRYSYSAIAFNFLISAFVIMCVADCKTLPCLSTHHTVSHSLYARRHCAGIPCNASRVY